jgi:hypothetical protein
MSLKCLIHYKKNSLKIENFDPGVYPFTIFVKLYVILIGQRRLQIKETPWENWLEFIVSI